MISKLTGTISDIFENFIILDCGGVGYKVTLAAPILNKAKVGQNTSYYIYTHVAEDILALYGFDSKKELGFFEMLLTVSNIGPKTALAIFNLGTVDEILEAITRADTDFFLNAPRIGRKNGQRIIVELRGKIGALGEIDLTFEESQEQKDITQALLGFGFQRGEIRDVLKRLPKEGSVEEKIKAALKSIAKYES